jgi:hypothetical protein
MLPASEAYRYVAERDGLGESIRLIKMILLKVEEKEMLATRKLEGEDVTEAGIASEQPPGLVRLG